MPRITSRMITDRWIAAFEKNEPFTPSEKRMMGIKLSQLKKNIKAHLVTTGRQTDLSVEEIIMDGIEYATMTNQPFRSIASLGYKILDQSLDYWEKRRKMEEIQKQDEVKKAEEFVQKENYYSQKSEKELEQVIKESYNKVTTRKAPQWMNTDEW